ncbi:MAG: type II secretion system GspH family protein [Gammaproteobacteria bacterium]|nr:type II secretion system GspH family protein [Gammaproteobacteria bacterium]
MSIIKDRMKGFTLVEMAVVVAISGLLTAGGFQLFASSNDTANYKQTQHQMSEIKESLISGYIKTGRLPCPDTGSDGIEDRNANTGACDNNGRGFLPHVTLNMANSAADAWGERFKYIVSGDNTHFFTKPTSNCSYARPVTAEATTVNIKDLTTSTESFLAKFSAFALLSTGKNGRLTNTSMTGAFTNDGGCSSLDALEQENCNNDSLLRYGVHRGDANSIVFDDLVVWMGDVELLTYLMQAGCSVSGDYNSGGGGGGSSGETTEQNPPSETQNCDWWCMLIKFIMGLLGLITGLFR